MLERVRNAPVAVGALVGGEIGGQRVREQLVREPVGVDGARLQHMGIDRAIDESRRGTRCGAGGLSQ